MVTGGSSGIGLAIAEALRGRGAGSAGSCTSAPSRRTARSPAAAPHGVSEGGLEALARSQAEAWSDRGVTCHTLVPGFVQTPLNARLSADPEGVRALAARTLVGRNGLAETPPVGWAGGSGDVPHTPARLTMTVVLSQ